MYNQKEQIPYHSASTAHTSELEMHYTDDTSLEGQACAIDPELARKKDYTTLETVQIPHITLIETAQVKTKVGKIVIQRDDIGHSQKLDDTEVVALLPKLSTFGMTIEKDAVTLGEPLDLEELESVSKDIGIKAYIRSCYENKTLYNIEITKKYRTAHLTVTKGNSSNFNMYLYLSAISKPLTSLLSQKLTPLNNKLKEHLTIFKEMLSDTIKASTTTTTITSECTDIVNGFFTIEGKYSISEVNKISDQLTELFYKTDEDIAKICLHTCSHPEVLAIKYHTSAKLPQSHSSSTLDNGLTYVIMHICLNIPHQDRVELLCHKKIIPLSLQIGSEIPMNQTLREITKEIWPIKIILIEDTMTYTKYQGSFDRYYFGTQPFMPINNKSLLNCTESTDDSKYVIIEPYYQAERNQEKIVLVFITYIKPQDLQNAIKNASSAALPWTFYRSAASSDTW